MKLSAQGKLRLAAKLAFAAGASSLLGVAQAADNGAAAPASGASAPDSNLLVAQAGGGATTTTSGSPVKLQGIVVTGSRIKQPSLTSSAALDVINSKEFKLEGTVNVENLLNSMPQVSAGFGNTSNNGATGTATVDLRGLGPSRTLVLIDGKRVVPGDPTLNGNNAADLNFIPAALVERVDVLTGGASAIYGSDAISGVVNFIMKKDFQGFTLDAQYGQAGEGDAHNYTATAIFGTNFAGGDGNVTMYAGYTRFLPLLQGQRSFSQAAVDRSSPYLRAYYAGNPNYASYSHVYDQLVNAGSATRPNTTFFDLNNGYYGAIKPTGTGLQSTFVPAPSTPLFNYNPFNYLQRPDKRYTLGGFAHRQFNEHLDVYGSAMFMSDDSTAQLAPSGTFFSSVVTLGCHSAPAAGTTTVDPFYNPLLSSSERAALCGTSGADTTSVILGHRFVEIGNRTDTLRHTDYRIVLGARGAIDDAWSYDVSAQRSESILSENFNNDVSKIALGQALNAVAPASNPSTTNPADAVCPAGSLPGCSPLNIFQFNPATGQAPISQAAINFVAAPGFSQGGTVEEVVSASVTGDLGKYRIQSPLAKSGAQLAAGFEYRRESLQLRAGKEEQSGDLSGFGGQVPNVDGAFNVRDWFGELQVPLIEDRPFAKELSIDTAYRLSKYGTSAGAVHAYKMGVRWAPIEDVTVRASWNRAVRAPNVNELFFPQSNALFAGTDPCGGTSPSASQAQCARMGVTAAEYGKIPQCPAAQCNQIIGGNPSLQAERAITRQIGLVLTPRFLKGFTGSIDYYDIAVGNTISTVPATTSLSGCIQTGDPTLCSNVHRGPGGVLFGPLGVGVLAGNVNIGQLKQRGVDFTLNYSRYLSDLGLPDWGHIDIGFYGTWLNSFQTATLPALFPASDCAGLYGLFCGIPNPRWRHNMRFSWTSPDAWVTRGLGVSFRWRYIGSAILDEDKKPTDPQISTGSAFDKIDYKIPVRQYLDMTLSYRVPLPNQDLTVRFGVTNLTKTNPPIVATSVGTAVFYTANTFPQLYDSLGRTLFLGFTANFR